MLFMSETDIDRILFEGFMMGEPLRIMIVFAEFSFLFILEKHWVETNVGKYFYV